MIGDPTEGALVVLAEKGGIDVDADPRALPARRRAAVRHRLQADGDVPPHDRRAGQRGRPLLRQGRARPAAGARRRRTSTRRSRPRRGRRRTSRRATSAENERLAEQGLRVMATARKDFDPATFDPGADLLALMEDLTLLALVGIVDPPRPAAKAAIAIAHDGRHPGPHDHRRPRGHRRGDRARARHRGPRDHRRGVRRAQRRAGRRARSTTSASSRASRPSRRCASSTSSSARATSSA